jgi:hypothetical protein
LFTLTTSSSNCGIKNIGVFSDVNGLYLYGTSTLNDANYDLKFSLSDPMNMETKYIIATTHTGSKATREI